MSLFFRATRRHLSRQPLLTMLSVTGTALGVAVVLAVDLVNHSALRAFQLAERAVSGDATHTIVPASSNIPDTFYRDLRVEYGFQESAPRVTGTVRTPNGRTLQVLGIDPLAGLSNSPLGRRSPESRIDPGVLIATKNAVVLTIPTARNLGVSSGDNLAVTGGGRQHALKVIGLLGGGGAAVEGLRHVLVVDVSTAQVLLDKIGGLSRIDLRLDRRERRRLESLLPASLELRASGSRSHAMEQMTRAFRMNLSALSLLALLIGAFLIYNTQTLFVLNRRETLAVWRTLGITRPQIVAMVIAEAVWLALAGGLLGCLAGMGLSRVLLDMVTRTIDDLYFSLQVTNIALDPVSIAKAYGLGLAAAMSAAALPALEASRIQSRLALSRSHVESSARRIRRVGVAVAVPMWLLAATILSVSQRSVAAGFSALFFIVAGFAFLVPGGLRVITRCAIPVLERCFGWMGLWSARNILASMSRTQIAVTALTIALAATIGVSVMIQSFRLTVVHWLDNYLRADIYISRVEDNGASMPPGLLRRLRRQPGVDAMHTGRWRRLPTEGEPTRLFVLNVNARGFENFQLVNRTNRNAWRAFSTDDAVMVSESYAYHHRLEPGDPLGLPTAQGDHRFTVIDVFHDYRSDRGRVVMHRDIYARYWNDPVIESIAVYLAPGTDGERFLADIEGEMLRGSGLVARSNRKIKNASLEIFDRTFAVTEVLRLLTLIVACIGILSALVAIQLDRSKEFAVLRASGLTRGELARVMMIEGGVMGTASAILSIPLGIALAAVLVFVINKRSFGWSMQLSLPWEPIFTALILGLVAGAVAAIYPAWRMNRQLPIANLRHE